MVRVVKVEAEPAPALPLPAASLAGDWLFSEAAWGELLDDAELAVGSLYGSPPSSSVKLEEDGLFRLPVLLPTAVGSTPPALAAARTLALSSRSAEARRRGNRAAASPRTTPRRVQPPRARATQQPASRHAQPPLATRHAPPRSAARAKQAAPSTTFYVKPRRTGGQCVWTAEEVAELTAAVACHRYEPTLKRPNGIHWAEIRDAALAGRFPLIGARLQTLSLKGNKTLQRRWYEFEGKADSGRKSFR